jgi:hypothetical protein
MRVSWFNAEHYFSPTEHDGMLNVLLEEKRKRYRPLVYICSPYAGDVERNVENARRYCRFAVDSHYIPVASHLLYPQFMDDGNEDERDLGLFFGKVLMDKCSEVWVFGECSEGMKSELNRAKRRSMTVRRFADDGETISEVSYDQPL